MSKRTPKWLDNALVVGPKTCLLLSDEAYRSELGRFGWITPEMIDPFVDRSHAKVHVLVSPQGNQHAFVCLDQKRAAELPNIVVAALLVHEAVHVFQFHCNFVGENDPSAEFEAYAIQRISQELMTEYMRQLGAGGAR